MPHEDSFHQTLPHCQRRWESEREFSFYTHIWSFQFWYSPLWKCPAFYVPLGRPKEQVLGFHWTSYPAIGWIYIKKWLTLKDLSFCLDWRTTQSYSWHRNLELPPKLHIWIIAWVPSQKVCLEIHDHIVQEEVALGTVVSINHHFALLQRLAAWELVQFHIQKIECEPSPLWMCPELYNEYSLAKPKKALTVALKVK